MRIFELRKNPESNPKIDPLQKLKELYTKHKNLYVSMTTVDKLGINPQSTYDTPLGIYSYHAEYVIKKTRSSERFADLPFAGTAPYINIFTLDNVLDIDNMTDSDVKNYLVKIEDVIMEDELFTNYNDEDYTELVLDEVKLYYNKSYSEALVKTPGGRFWYTTLLIAQRISGDTGKSKTSVPTVWNWLFRSIGIDSIASNTGIIHENEPDQCVIFNPKAINPIARLDNTHTSGQQLAGEYKKTSFQHRYGEMKHLVDTMSMEELVDMMSIRQNFLRLYDVIPTTLRHKILQNHPDWLQFVPTAIRKKLDIKRVLDIKAKRDDELLGDLFSDLPK